MERTPATVDLSLLVCTYNRCNDLRELLETALAQQTDGLFEYEVVVVDNNSTDDTRAVVEEMIAAGRQRLRYFFEPKQGKSHALNHGLQVLRGWAYVITDDDFLLPPNWVKEIFLGFKNNPDVAFVSGKVLPSWQGKCPPWLTQRHWSAIAMADYGDKQFLTDESNQICLLACAFRSADVAAVGGYHNDLGPEKDRTGATEDLELLTRLWKAGRKGLYLPHIFFHHKVTADRLTKTYHRKWHRDHGRSYAIMAFDNRQPARFRLFNVPAYLYRAAVTDAVKWLSCMLTGRRDKAFLYEAQLQFFMGFLAKRRADHTTTKTEGC